ncbi:MAG: hypothetical protein R2795_01445 [Saprospiraceae bacterium]
MRFLLAAVLGLLAWMGANCQPMPHHQPAVPFSVEELQKRTFNYFWDLALPGNYQIPDRWPTQHFSSIAATGFGLTAYIVGVERGYIDRKEAAARTLRTLQVLWKLPQELHKRRA